MLGFVSALASSIAVLILVISISMVNTVMTQIEKEEKLRSFTMVSDDGVNEEKGSHDLGKNEMISQNSVLPLALITSLSADDAVLLTCSYGKYYSFDVAEKFLTFNYLKLKANKKNIKVDVELIKDVNGINGCNLLRR
ncbi:hypothetical protein HJA72_004279 [Vibrio fluvialis]|nr:hypothetical protein [Vibrio fluvialis]